MTEHAALKQRTAWLSIFSNTTLVILKLIVGLYVGAVSLVSEALHSGVDLIAALIAFWAVKKSLVPPDEEHDYGHGKFENLSAAVEALLIVGAAVGIVYESAQKFQSAEVPEALGYGIAIMLVSIVVNILVSRRLIHVAKITGSQALEADGLHLQSDVWTSVGVLIGLALMQLTGWAWLDPAIAILVAGIIFRAGWRMRACRLSRSSASRRSSRACLRCAAAIACARASRVPTSCLMCMCCLMAICICRMSMRSVMSWKSLSARNSAPSIS